MYGGSIGDGGRGGIIQNERLELVPGWIKYLIIFLLRDDMQQAIANIFRH